MSEKPKDVTAEKEPKSKPAKAVPVKEIGKPKEFGGQTGPEPTRYGDWEKNGRCSDF